jgi:hypothetical protein
VQHLLLEVYMLKMYMLDSSLHLQKYKLKNKTKSDQTLFKVEFSFALIQIILTTQWKIN